MGPIGDLATAISASAELSFVFKLTVATMLGLATTHVARRTRASIRHIVLASTIAVLLALPIASAVLPAVAIAVPASRATVVPASPSTPGSSAARSARLESPGSTNAPINGTLLPSGQTLLRGAWGVGATLVVLSLTAALWRLRQLRRHGLPWLEARAQVSTLATQAGLRRPVDVLLHEKIPAPLTCGLLRPVIILPSDARDWSEAPLRRALVHELEHVRRHDWSVHLLARVACAVYWFHPLVWIACRQLALEAERAADDAVVEREEGTQYADQLVSLARRMAAHSAQPALGMAHRSDLSTRISAVLDRHQPRGRAGFMCAGVVAGVAAAIVVSLAPLRAVGPSTGLSVVATNDGEQRRGRVSWMDRALVEAVDSGDLADVKELLDEGANVNATVDGDGSPLIVAAREGELAIVTLLLDRGADPNLAVEGDGNPLIMAAREGHLKIVELLLSRGAHIDEVVPSDENALIQASGEGRLEVVKLLVARGADVNARVWVPEAYERPQGEWRTPLSMARRGNHGAVVALLVSAGATQ